MNNSTSRGKSIALIGALLQLGPVFGLLATASTPLFPHSLIAQSQPPDIKSFVTAVNRSIAIDKVIGLTGVAVGILGLLLLVIALASFRYRGEWLFWFLVIYGALLLLVVPIGTVVGVFFLVYCLTRRHEFLRDALNQ